MRPSSPELARAFADGAAAHGLDVTLIGLCSTDGLYYASGALDLPGAMFTASHNPAAVQRHQAVPSQARAGRAGHRPGRDPRPGPAAARRPAPDPRRERPGGAGTITERDLLGDYAAFLRAWSTCPAPAAEGRRRRRQRHGRPHRPGRRSATRAPALRRSCRWTSCRCTSSSTARSPTTRPTRSSRRTCATCRRPSSSTAPTSGWPSTATPTAASSSTSAASRSARAPSPRWSPAARSPRSRPPGCDAGDVPIVHNVITSARGPRDRSREHGARAGPHPGRPLVHQGRDGPRTTPCSAASTRAHYYFRDFWFADTGMLAAMHVLAALGEQDGPLSELVAELRAATPPPARSTPRVADAAAATAARTRSGPRPRTSTVDELDGLTVTHQGRRRCGGSTCGLQHRAAAAAQRRGGRRGDHGSGCATRCSPSSEESPMTEQTLTPPRTGDAVRTADRAVAARDPALPAVQGRARRRHRPDRARAAVHQRRVRAGLPGRRRHPRPAGRRSPLASPR